MSYTIESLPAGKWGIGLSGGADSVYLFHRIRETRPDIEIVIIHMNHQLRGAESDGDQTLVEELAKEYNTRIVVGYLNEMDHSGVKRSNNKEEFYREMRFKLFKQAVDAYNLQGVLLAHHANDQAETVLMRILRGSVYRGLAGISKQIFIRNVNIIRPLLHLRKNEIVEYLRVNQYAWREDSSNQEDIYTRNRIRKFLSGNDELVSHLCEFANTIREFQEKLEKITPRFDKFFDKDSLKNTPKVIVKEACRQWLISAGCPHEKISQKSVEQLYTMAFDEESNSIQNFPGNIRMCRKFGRIAVLDKIKQK